MKNSNIFSATLRNVASAALAPIVLTVFAPVPLLQAQYGYGSLKQQTEYLEEAILSYAANIDSISSSVTGHTLTWRTTRTLFFAESVMLPLAKIDPERLEIYTEEIGVNSTSTVLIYTVEDENCISIQRFGDDGDPVDDGSSMSRMTRFHFPGEEGKAFAEFFVEELRKAIYLAQ